MSGIRLDKELEQFRDIMKVPSHFQEGFSWASLIGAVFIALIMVPAGSYMGLLIGVGIGGSAQWVTLILFLEIARRAHKSLNRAEVYVLFFMASAAFRTFRAKNLSAALLLIAALAVMFGQVPISEVVGKWFGKPTAFNEFGNWLMTYPNTAAKRGVMLGVSLGLIAQSLRVIFGIERSYLGGGE